MGAAGEISIETVRCCSVHSSLSRSPTSAPTSVHGRLARPATISVRRDKIRVKNSIDFVNVRRPSQRVHGAPPSCATEGVIYTFEQPAIEDKA